MELSEGVFVSLLNPISRKDVEIGDKSDGFRVGSLKINRGRRWKQWFLPATTLRLDCRVTATPKRRSRKPEKK